MQAVNTLKKFYRGSLTKKKARTGGARAKKEFIINKIVKLRLGNTTIKDYSTKIKRGANLVFICAMVKKEKPVSLRANTKLRNEVILTWLKYKMQIFTLPTVG